MLNCPDWRFDKKNVKVANNLQMILYKCLYLKYDLNQTTNIIKIQSWSLMGNNCSEYIKNLDIMALLSKIILKSIFQTYKIK